MTTPHIEAKPGEIHPFVLMPGDPLRAKFIAENFLTGPRLVSRVRNMYAYSGEYDGVGITVMGSGMGIPSIGIYAHELYAHYGVEAIVRVGSCGAYDASLDLYDIVLAQGASSDSNFAHPFRLPGTIAALADFELLETAVRVARDGGSRVRVGNVLSSDVFYNADETEWMRWRQMGVLAVEMESYGLYLTAQRNGKKALSILTVSDSFCFEKKTTPEQRETSFTRMMEIALQTCILANKSLKN